MRNKSKFIESICFFSFLTFMIYVCVVLASNAAEISMHGGMA